MHLIGVSQEFVHTMTMCAGFNLHMQSLATLFVNKTSRTFKGLNLHSTAKTGRATMF